MIEAAAHLELLVGAAKMDDLVAAQVPAHLLHRVDAHERCAMDLPELRGIELERAGAVRRENGNLLPG